MLKEAMDYVKSLYRVPSAEALALSELEESKRKLLQAQSGRDYAKSMCNYYETKIARLNAYLFKMPGMK